MKAALHNLGCKVNAYETDAMAELLMHHGYEIVPFDERADVYVINTCTVTNIADRKSRQMIHKARKQNPDACIVAAGCYVQVSAEALITEGVCDILLGNDKKHELPRMLDRFFDERTVQCLSEDLSLPGRAFVETPIQRAESRTRAFIKIQDGCDAFCSYCMIPYARGRIRSRKTDSIVAEAARLAAAGYRELVLTGIHVSSFGRDTGETLMSLLLALDALTELDRLRLSSLEPRLITPEFAKQLQGLRTFCPHFHLSLQSGCDAVLQRMNRRYTTADFRETVMLLRSAFTHPAITTDVITGFPGETEKEFEETVSFLTELQLYELHVFPFSARKGTKAAAMPGQLTERIKKERSRVLLSLTEEQAKQFRAYYRGTEQEVLLEEAAEVAGEQVLTGLNREYVRFYVPAAGQKTNTLVRGVVYPGSTPDMDLLKFSS